MAKWDDWVSELIQKTDLVGLVSKYVGLNKKGATYWGCCPFHHEKTPSFAVNESKGFFYCFGCHAGGDAINFLSKIESMSKFEAMQILAESANMELPETEFKKRGDYAEVQKNKGRLLELLRESARHYHQNLKDERAKIATDYLEKRGITEGMITKFGLGYSLGYEHIIDHLTAKGYTAKEMMDAGIAAQKADRYYDVFAKRLMIPILDFKGDVVAFGGRLLEQSDFAKYRNSSQTAVFDKSRTVFALNLVKRKKQKEGLKHIILAEGYMDVIALHKAGFTEAAASMGTALTAKQAQQIKGLCDNVYISFDGDSAGQKAALKGLDILENEGLNVKVIVPPDGLDPDDIINKYGAERYKTLISEALTLTAFKIETLRRAYDLSTPDGKSAFTVEAIKVIKSRPNPVEREDYIRSLHTLTGYSINTLFSQADLVEPEINVPQTPITHVKREEVDKNKEAKEFILSQLIADKPYIDKSEDLYSLLGDDYGRIFLMVSEAQRRANYTPAYLYQLIEPDDEEIIGKLINYEIRPGDDAKKYFSCVNMLKIERLVLERDEAAKMFNDTKDNKWLEQIKRLAAQINELKRRD